MPDPNSVNEKAAEGVSDTLEASNESLSFDPEQSHATLSGSSSDMSFSKRKKSRKSKSSKRDTDKRRVRKSKKGENGKKNLDPSSSETPVVKEKARVRTASPDQQQADLDPDYDDKPSDKVESTSQAPVIENRALDKQQDIESNSDITEQPPLQKVSVDDENGAQGDKAIISVTGEIQADAIKSIGDSAENIQDAVTASQPLQGATSLSPAIDEDDEEKKGSDGTGTLPATTDTQTDEFSKQTEDIGQSSHENQPSNRAGQSLEASEGTKQAVTPSSPHRTDSKTADEDVAHDDSPSDGSDHTRKKSERPPKPQHPRSGPLGAIIGTGSVGKMRGKKSSFSTEEDTTNDHGPQELPTIAESSESGTIPTVSYQGRSESATGPRDSSTRTDSHSHRHSAVSGLTSSSVQYDQLAGATSSSSLQTKSQSHRHSEMSTITGNTGTAEALDKLNRRFEATRKVREDVDDNNTFDGRSIDEMTMTDISVVTLDPALDYSNKVNPFSSLASSSLNPRVHDVSPAPPPRGVNLASLPGRSSSGVSEDMTLDMTIEEEHSHGQQENNSPAISDHSHSPNERESVNASIQAIIPESPMLNPGFSLLVGPAAKDPELRRRNARSKSRERPQRSNSNEKQRSNSSERPRARSMSNERNQRNDEPATPLRRVLSKNAIASSDGDDSKDDFIMVPMQPREFVSPRLERSPSSPPLGVRAAIKDTTPLSAKRLASPEADGRQVLSPSSRRALARQKSAPHIDMSPKGKRYETLDSKLSSGSRRGRKLGKSTQSLGAKLTADEATKPRKSRGSSSLDTSKRKKQKAKELKEVEKRLAASLSRLQMSITNLEDSGSSLSALNESNSQLGAFHQSMPAFNTSLARFDESFSGLQITDATPTVPRSKKSLVEKLASDGKKKSGSKSGASRQSSGEKRRKPRKSRAHGYGGDAEKSSSCSNLDLSGIAPAPRRIPSTGNLQQKVEALEALHASNKALEKKVKGDEISETGAIINTPSTATGTSSVTEKVANTHTAVGTLSLSSSHGSPEVQRPASLRSLASGTTTKSGAKSRSSSKSKSPRRKKEPSSPSILEQRKVEDDSTLNSDIHSQASPDNSLHDKLQKVTADNDARAGDDDIISVRTSGTMPSLVEFSVAGTTTSTTSSPATAAVPMQNQKAVVASRWEQLRGKAKKKEKDVTTSKRSLSPPPKLPLSPASAKKEQVDSAAATPRARSRWAGLRKSMQFIVAAKSKAQSTKHSQNSVPMTPRRTNATSARRQVIEEAGGDDEIDSTTAMTPPQSSHAKAKVPLDLSQIEGTPHIEIVDGKRCLVIELDDEEDAPK